MRHIPLIFLAILGICLNTWSFAPGMMSADSINQYEQAMSGTYNDMHPPIVALIWRYLLFLSNDQNPMFFLQLGCFWIGLVLIALSQDKLWKQLFILSAGFLPQLFVQFGMIWKDVALVGFYTLGIGLVVLRDKYLKTQRLLGSVILFIAVCFLWVGTATRHNALLTVIPLLFFYFYSRYYIWRSTFYTGFAIAFYLLTYTFVVDNVLQAKHLHPGGQIFLYDTVGIAAATGDESVIPNFISQDIKVDKKSLITSYTPQGGGSVFFWGGRLLIPTQDNWNEEAKESWMYAVQKYPLQYIAHRFHVFISVIGLDQKEVYYPWHETVDGNPYGVHASNRSITVKVLQFMNTLKQGLIFRVWVYICIGILLLLLTYLGRKHFFSGNSTVGFLILGLTISALLHTAAYFFIAPVSDLRLNYWTIDAILLASLLFISESLKSRES